MVNETTDGNIETIPPNSKLTKGKIEKNQQKVIEQKITKRKPLYILLPYIKGGADTSFLRSAKFKKKRLKEQYPDAVYWIEPFTTLDEFKLIWKKIYNITTENNTKYNLKELHYFGHSGHDSLYFLGSSFSLGMETQLEKLTFSKQGALILHSCLSSRYEENTVSMNKNCIARALSQHLQTKVIGQMIRATNTTGDTLDDLKYRNYSSTNSLLIDIVGQENIALWGYNAGRDAKRLSNTEEYRNLKSYQIWPARGYDKGLELPRIIHPDYFNQIDLIYI